MSDVVEVSRKIYDNLMERSAKLACLECGGVDNWSGYGECYDAPDCGGYNQRKRDE